MAPVLEPTYAKLGLGVTGAVAFLTARFMIWRRAHDQVCLLEVQVARRGRLAIEFVPGTRRDEETSTHAYQVRRRTPSLGLRKVGGAGLTNCRLVLADMEPNEGNLMLDVPPPMGTVADPQTGRGGAERVQERNVRTPAPGLARMMDTAPSFALGNPWRFGGVRHHMTVEPDRLGAGSRTSPRSRTTGQALRRGASV